MDLTLFMKTAMLEQMIEQVGASIARRGGTALQKPPKSRPKPRNPLPTSGIPMGQIPSRPPRSPRKSKLDPIPCSCRRVLVQTSSQVRADAACANCSPRRTEVKKGNRTDVIIRQCPCGATGCPGDHFLEPWDETRQRALEDLLEAARLVKTDPARAELAIIQRVEEIDRLPVEPIKEEHWLIRLLNRILIIPLRKN